MKTKKHIFHILQWSTILVFLGRAYQHWFWDAPFRVLLWDESWMKPIVETITGSSWESFVTSETGDIFISSLIQTNGIFYFLFAVFTLFIIKFAGNWSHFLLVGSGMLIFLAFLYMKEHFFNVGQFFEYSLQFGSPIFLWLYLRHWDRNKLLLWMKIAIALTFTCHGLYALGYYPVPGSFVEMTINIFHIESQSAFQFLKLAGTLDFLVAILIFVPKVSRFALLYAFFWGFITSFARIWAHFYIEMPWESLHQWIPEFLYRAPHFLIPLGAYFISIKQQNYETSD